MDQLLTVAQTAERLQISDRTLREWISQGSIPFFKLGETKRSLVRFSWPAVEAWLQERSKGPAERLPAPAPRRPGKASEATVSQFKAYIEGHK